MKEQEHHKKAFEFYYGLGEGRSYKLVAEEFGVSLATVKVWGKSFGWRVRLRERDGEAARAMADDNLKSATEKMARNRKIVEMALIQVAKAIAEGKVKPTLSDLDRLMRLEGFLRRGAGAHEEQESMMEEVKRRYAARQKERAAREDFRNRSRWLKEGD